MIIDCHSHVMAFPKIKPYPQSKTTLMSAEQQIALEDTKGVDKAIILPLIGSAPFESQNVGEILYICQKYPGRFIPFCNIDPRLPKHPDMIKVDDFDFLLGQYKELGCKGIGEVIVRIQWDHPLMLLLLEACEKVNFAITFHTLTADFNNYGIIDEMGLPGLEMVLTKFPKLNFFGHSMAFWSEISGDVTLKEKNGYPKGKVVSGGKIIELMRKYPNLYGDLSAGSGLSALQRDPEHAWKFIDEFQDRLMLGLDYCSPTNDMQHIEWLTKAKDNNNISSQAYEKIMWKNINRVLELRIK